MRHVSWYGLVTFCAVYSLAVATPGPGVAYLLYLAYRLWTTPARRLDPTDAPNIVQRPLASFLGSLSLTLGNPKPMIFFVALLPTVVNLESLPRMGYVEIAAAIAVILPAILGTYVLAAARARVWFQSPRATQRLNRSSGTLMAAAAVAVATR
jgi:threonine/homoserine/homoserine lactone efflux protein